MLFLNAFVWYTQCLDEMLRVISFLVYRLGLRVGDVIGVGQGKVCCRGGVTALVGDTLS